MRFPAEKERVLDLLRYLGPLARSPGRVYLVGGGTALLAGWRDKTLDVDMKLDPEPGGIFEAIEKAKNSLGINIELASPEQFVPPLPGWRERSVFIARHGLVDFYHYDPYGQALAKLERAHDRDLADVRAMVQSGWVIPGKLRELFSAVKPLLVRYPAVDAEALTRAVEAL